MVITEESMCFLEEHIPELVDSAIKQAYWQALATGNSVLQYEEGSIFEVFSDGTRNLVKTLSPQLPANLGQRVIIK